ncbi:hypothetical protein ACFQS2_15125 [Brachybacterium sp. GCM10030267]|uniref:hypothetical protein n=1 Tax=unclassified Brachybacterium TaxID=2623841 RepID=UPI0036243627
MSNQRVAIGTDPADQQEGKVASSGNSLVLSVVLFLVLFGLFAAGLYVMSLFTMWTFLGGLGMCLVALFASLELVPRFLT